MKNQIEFDIEKEAKKLAQRFQLYHNYLHLDHLRNKKRVNDAPNKLIHTQDQWEVDKKFNPFYVLNHLKQISRSVEKKIKNETYVPLEPFQKTIPKKGGGTRNLTIYQIPDAAVSNRLYLNLLSKNKHRFSGLSYAYRNDRNVHYAIQDIAYELKSNPRLFIAEFDFKDFFGSINHDFLYQQLSENSFLISSSELRIIKAFINQKDVGIPLGTSISLFIANVICWKLDRKLEEAGLRFARYADDTIIWSPEYGKICRAFEIMNEFSQEASININERKSEGISLLSKPGIPSEFGKTKNFIEFLGYRVSAEKVSIKASSIRKIKKQISYLLYRNLIQPVKTHPYRAVTIPNNDEDDAFVTSVMQIRRYLYGNLTEFILKKYLKGHYKKLTFKGIMSFYPLINDKEQLLEMDKWMISTILNALRLRCQLLKTPHRDLSSKFPFNLNHDTIIIGCRQKVIKRKRGLIEIPSFLRIFEAIKMGIINDGIDSVMNMESNNYNYDFD